MGSLLGLAVCAVLAGSTAFAAIADWLADLDPSTVTRLHRADPVGTALWRVLVRVDADALAAVLAGWLRSRAAPPTPPSRRQPQAVIAVDGKTVHGARQPDRGQLHLLSAYNTDSSIVLAQVQVPAKSNEIGSLATVLDRAEATHRIPGRNDNRHDALHTQTATPVTSQLRAST